jgi:zinc protease
MTRAPGGAWALRRRIFALVSAVFGGELVGSGCLAAQAPSVARRPATEPAFEVPRIRYERFTLPNGLRVLVAEDHAVPIVAVVIWYHVGSKDEKPGRTGFAHLFEHMMFQGSAHVGNGAYVKTVEEGGGSANGTTGHDRTDYYEVVPTSELETALWLESDRMGFLLPTLDQGKLDRQRAVVKNERREGTDNMVFGTADEVLAKALYPAAHPYSWPVIGSMVDLDAATLDNVKEFFQTYYTPGNATVVLAGDVTPARARALVTKYFGSIPAGPPVTRTRVPSVSLDEDRRLVLEDSRTTLPRLTMVWPTVPEGHPDAAALDALSHLLTGHRTARLTKLLTFDRELVTSVWAGQTTRESAGEFTIGGSPRPGASLTEVERLVDSVLASVVIAPFTAAELERYKAGVRVGAVMGLENNHAKAEKLASGEVFHGDPLHYVSATNAALAVMLPDVERVARTYLTTGRVVLSMVPAGQTSLRSRPDLPSTNVTPANGK